MNIKIKQNVDDLNLVNKFLDLEHIRSFSEKKIAHYESLKLYDEALIFLSTELGKIHKVRQTKTYWQPIIGLWLREFCVIYLDRINLLNSLTDKQKSVLSSFGEMINYVPTDHEDWNATAFASPNLDISILQSFLLPEHKLRSGSLDKAGIAAPKIRKVLYIVHSYKLFFTLLEIGIFSLIHFLKRGQVIYYSSDLIDRKTKFKIFFKSKARILPMPKSTSFLYKFISYILPKQEYSSKTREELLNKVLTSSKENKTFLVNVIRNLPRSYLENFAHNFSILKILFKIYPSQILLDTGRYNDKFKILLSEWISSGTKTAVIQHSLDSLLDCDSIFAHDDCFDKYYTWGLSSNSKHEHMPSLRLSRAKKEIQRLNFRRNDQNPSIIDLYVCRSLSRKQTGSLSLTTYEANIIREGRAQLAKIFSGQKNKTLLVRPRPSDLHGHGSNSVDEFINFPNISITPLSGDEKYKNIYDLFVRSRIVIYENLSTGLCECLISNIPCILYLYQNYLAYEDSVGKDLLATLNELGIVFYKPESVINNLNDDFINNWNTNEFQDSKRIIENNFMLTSENYIEEWIEHLI